jgi:hypothetical protein
VGCSRSHIYESYAVEEGITGAEKYMQTARMLRFIGEYFEGGAHTKPIDPKHCKNCLDIYETIKSIESDS